MDLKENIEHLLKYINNMDEEQKRKLSKLFDGLNNLGRDHKEELLENIISLSLSELESIQNRIKKYNCELEGHVYGDWEVSFLTFDEESYGTDPRKIRYWKRTCERCRLIDVSSVDPKEIEKQKGK